MSGMMVVILALVIVVGVKTKAENTGSHIADDTENSYEQQVAGQTDTTQDSGQEKWQEGVVAYQGKEYLYNTDIKTYLMMGVDIDGPVQQSSDYTQGGQSDALFLLVVNNKTEQLQVISINRNTMADIELCDEEGIDMGPLKTQICLQHAFGDGKRLSCGKTVDAVSGLFQNIPISGYLAMNMGGIPQMNDAVGGVEVTVQQDISFPKAGVNLKKGQKVTLNGTQAYYYLHGRDTEEYDSATKRLQREEQYIVAYMDKIKKVSTENPDQVTEIYNSVSDYLVTSVDFTSMIELLWSDKVGYVWLAIGVNPVYVDTGIRIESAADLCYRCLDDVATDVLYMTGNDHALEAADPLELAEIKRRWEPYINQLPDYAYLCKDLLNGKM